MKERKRMGINQKKTALVIDPKDNVAVALTDIKNGEVCTIKTEDREQEITVIENIPFGHKIAVQRIESNESVYKYGEEIGKMKQSVEKGGWVHSHNMYCERGMKYGR